MPPAPIYLDHNATAPIDPAVVEAMARAWKDFGANPASQHSLGRKSRRALEDTREGILELLGAKTGGMDADQLIFTSGGTEANNLALLGLAGAIPWEKTLPGQPQKHPPVVFISAMEHPSVAASAAEANRRGFVLKYLLVHPDGAIEVADTSHSPVAIQRPSVLSLMLANNETGITLAVDELPISWREAGALIHTDAAQAVGKIPVNFGKLGVHAMTVAPHKFHGPLGIGALVVRHGVKLQPQLFGGFQQGALRPGTENVPLAIGFHEALELAITQLGDRAARMKSLRDQLEKSLREAFPGLVIVGENSPRLPNTSCIAFPGINRQALVMALDLAGVACSTGSACASGSSEPSPSLAAMGLPKAVVEGSIRLSLGAFTTPAEVGEAARRIVNCVNHLRSQK
jgi:cysteine desulfurase